MQRPVHLSPASVPSTRFRCEIHPDRDAARVVPHGELDLATTPAVRRHLDDLREAGFRELVLDLRRLSFMDVSAVRLIRDWGALVRSDGVCRFAVIPGCPLVQRLFSLTQTCHEIDFVDAREDRALGAATGSPAPPFRQLG